MNKILKSVKSVHCYNLIKKKTSMTPFIDETFAFTLKILINKYEFYKI